MLGVAAYVLSITNRTSLSAVGVDAAHLFQAERDPRLAHIQAIADRNIVKFGLEGTGA